MYCSGGTIGPEEKRVRVLAKTVFDSGVTKKLEFYYILEDTG